MNNMNKIKDFLLYLWQLPQHIVGLVILLFITGEAKHKFNGINYYFYDPFPGGISLGNYMIIGETWSQTIKHEYGHSIQSRMLGPLYLFVIGIPSLIWAWLYGPIIKPTKNGYYRFYTESWADKLGKVKR